ncbi:MAG: endonuclease III [Deltaproteobacteria bacterium]|nr:endonuclease III [Deltaproteobacteria bacterium]
MSRSRGSDRRSPIRRRARAALILDRLVAHHPDAAIELRVGRGDPWQLLVAVVLSAQCTDAKVNAATPALFIRYSDAAAMAAARPRQIEPYIRSLGLANAKSRYLVAAARKILADHGGRVPATRAELEALPGIGRKSASVILANAFGVPALAVDTHVGRVARRLGLTGERDPSKVEAALERLWPSARWLVAHHTLIRHGRRICRARGPDCGACPVSSLCPRIDVARPRRRRPPTG